MFKVILGYKEILKSAWDAGDPFRKNQRAGKTKLVAVARAAGPALGRLSKEEHVQSRPEPAMHWGLHPRTE